MNKNFQITLLNTKTFLACLLPISLIFSIFIADLIVVILFITFFIVCFKYKNFSYFNNLYFKLFFSYWIYITTLSFFSENFLEAFLSSFTYIRFIVLPLIILYLINKDKNFTKYFFYTLLITIGLLIFDSFFEYFLGNNILGYGGLEEGRLVSFFKDEYILGSYINKLFFLIASLWFIFFDHNNFKNNLLFLIFYFLCFITVFISGDRMPFLLFLIGSFIFLILSEFNIKMKLSFILLSIIFILSSLYFNQNLYDRVIKKTLREIGSTKGLRENSSRLYSIDLENNKKITFLTQHQNYFIVNYKIFKENPIFGKGNKGFKFNCHKYKLDGSSCSSHPHNIYLQLLSENGLIGFSFFFSIFLWVTYIFLINLLNIFRKNKKNILSNSKLCILICVYLNLWPVAQTGNIFNNWVAAIYFLPIGFLLSEFNLKK
jgi:O-antigen ligase